jgi:hypothetical protein
MGAAADRAYTRYTNLSTHGHGLSSHVQIRLDRLGRITSGDVFVVNLEDLMNLYLIAHRKMFAPRSKKSATVQQKASPSCRIWFVCKGNLVCTRYALGTWMIL